MEKQVLSIEQMQELINMDIDISRASFFWITYFENDDVPDVVTKNIIKTLKFFDYEINKIIPTFTLQDILKYLEKIKPTLTKDDGSIWFMEVHNLERDSLMYCEGCESESPLETAFKTLKWCKQNNYI